MFESRRGWQVDSLPPLLIKTRRRRRRRQIWQKPQTRRHHPRQKKSPKKSNFGGLCHPFFAATFCPSFFSSFRKHRLGFPLWFGVVFPWAREFFQDVIPGNKGLSKQAGEGKEKNTFGGDFSVWFFSKPFVTGEDCRPPNIFLLGGVSPTFNFPTFHYFPPKNRSEKKKNFPKLPAPRCHEI